MLPIACYFENAIPRVEDSRRPDSSSTTFDELYKTYHLENNFYQTQFASGEIGEAAKRKIVLCMLLVNVNRFLEISRGLVVFLLFVITNAAF